MSKGMFPVHRPFCMVAEVLAVGKVQGKGCEIRFRNRYECLLIRS